MIRRRLAKEKTVTERKAPSVSLCMIVRDEERNLGACLAPIAALFHEIVVVDTGSRDRTKEAALRFTSHVVDFEWCDDFSAARNESLRRSHGDWIFWLDADDRLDSANVAKLRDLLRGLDDRPAAYFMDTVCSAQYECEDSRLISHCRLFRRHPALKWQGRVHEQLRPNLSQFGYELVASNVQIEHVGYLSATEVQRKVQRDIRLLRMDYAINPNDTSTLLHLGLAHARMGNSSEARKLLLPLLSRDLVAADYVRQVYCVLTDLTLRDGQFSETVQLAVQGLRSFPEDEHLRFLRAEALYELDEYAAAQQILTGLINEPQTWHYHAGSPSHIRQKLAPRRLADVLRLQGDSSAAETLLLEILNRYPNDSISWHALGQLYIQTNQWQPLDKVAGRLRACPQGDVFADLLLVAWHLAHGEFNPAERLIEGLIGRVPQMPLPRLMRAELLIRRGAPRQDLIQACRDLLRVQPGNAEGARVLARLENAQESIRVASAENGCMSVVLGAGIPGGMVIGQG
jgi:tetratricopeptide (TPR) repeat protein